MIDPKLRAIYYLFLRPGIPRSDSSAWHAGFWACVRGSDDKIELNKKAELTRREKIIKQLIVEMQ